MAFSAGGSSAPTVSAYEGGERVGGKLLNRSHRRNRATLYDRPPAARGSSWISKVVVDPAKKLIAASARTFFSSVFSKRLPPPPPTPLLPAPEAIPELSNGLEDPVRQNGVLQLASVDSQYVTTEDTSMPTELMQLLKQNTFTRPEVDHLIKLLDSKAPDLPATDDVRRVESSLSKPVMEFQRQEKYSKDSSMENWRERDQFHAVLEEDITFPTELAKEYMGSSWTTPRFKARSAIRKMASSITHTPPFHRGSGSNGKSSVSPPLLTEPSRKRSSVVLDDFRSGGGTIRRIRRKYGVASHKVDLPFSENYNSCSGQPFSLTHKGSFMDDWRLKGSILAKGVENTNNSSPRFSHLPLKSSQHSDAKLIDYRQRTPFKLTTDMLSGKALKSLESLDSLKLLQGTKDGENLEESSRDVASTSQTQNEAKENGSDKSHPLQLEFTSQTQNGSAENGPERSNLRLDCTSQKQNEAEENGPGKSLFQPEFTSHTQNGAEEYGPEKSNLQLDFTSKKQNEVEGNGPEKSLFQLEFISQKHNGTDENGPEKSRPQIDTTFYMDRDHTSGSPRPFGSITISVVQKKHAFMMSVPEDFLDMDEDTDCNKPATESLLKEKKENNTILAEENTCPPKKLILDESPALLETRKAPLENVSVSDNSNVSVGGDGTSVSPSLPLQLSPRPASSSFSLEKSKNVESPSASISEVSHTKFSPLMQPEPLRPIRLGDAPADVSLQVPESGKHQVNIPQEGVNENEKAETKSSVVSSSNIESGPVHLNLSTVSSMPLLASTSFGNQASVDAPNVSSSAVSTPVIPQNSATSTSLILPVSQPSVPLLSTFTFGASDKTSTGSVPAAPTFTFGAIDKTSTGSAPSAPTFTFGAFDKTSTGSAPSVPTFTFDASNKASTASVPASVTKNEADKEVSPISAIDSHIHSSTDKSQPQDVGIPFQFGSSTTAFSTGTSGIAPFIANNTVSSPATSLFGSVPSLSSSTSSLSEIKSVTSAASSGSSSNTFTFGSTVSSGPNAVTSSNGNTPSVFNFGAGSSGTTTASSSVVTPGMFNFGATSVPTPNSAPFSATFNQTPSGVFAFGASPNVPTMASFGASSNAPTMASFGASSNVPTMASFGASPNVPTMASFGASPNIPTMASFGASSTPTQSTFTNHDQMNGEDSMAEDPMQSSPIAGFGHQVQQQQPPSLPPPVAGGFPFGSTAPPTAAPPGFPFGGVGQQSQVGFQNNSFQGSGDGFSLGSNGGGDKSGRKFVKANRNRNRSKK